MVAKFKILSMDLIISLRKMFEKYSSNNPVNRIRMTCAFAFSHPAHIIASFFASGVIRPAPGTWGTLAGWIVFVLLDPWIPYAAWFFIVAATFFIGAWACQKTSEDLGVQDHGSIVIDEVFAIWLLLALMPPTLLWQIAAFVAFRFFDIVKLPPADYFDKKMKNGFGIMLDDAIAAVYAWLILFAVQWVLY